MRARNLAVLLGACLAGIAAVGARAEPCAGFGDVDAASPFCENVQWLRNRAITLGCSPGAYCGGAAVSRLSMAAFLNRLGNVLTPQSILVEDGTNLDLSSQSVICQTPELPIAGYPRRVVIDAALSGVANAAATISANLVVSETGGALWTSLSSFPTQLTLPQGAWQSFTEIGLYQAEISTGLRFGLRIARVAGEGVMLSNRCQLRATLYNREGTSPPI